MFSKVLTVCTLSCLLLFSEGANISAAPLPAQNAKPDTGTFEKMIVASGNVALDLNVNLLNGGSAAKDAHLETLHFTAAPNSFLPIVVFNNELRGPMPGSIALTPEDSVNLPPVLRTALDHLVLEKTTSDQAFEFVVRDGKTGFVYFNIDRISYDYDSAAHSLRISGGRLLMSEALATNLERAADAGAVVGNISVSAVMHTIEKQVVVNGEVESATLPPSNEARTWNPEVFSSGPDVIVGDLPSLQQFGSSGSTVGLAVATTSCNAGDVQLDWFALPNVDHPVIPQNLYRLSGGTNNDARLEQIGQSWLKHAFTALQQNACTFGCSSAPNGTHLGVGCSDPYDASLNGTQSGLGSRAWVNPFTGVYPSTARDHTGHTHTGVSHRIAVAASDLNTTLNVGATYYAEGQYVTPHEYTWCQANPGQCNMYNNVSYRRFNVTGTTSFTFAAVGATVRMASALTVWPGATINTVEPAPGVDGRAFVAYKVTGPVNGMWQYEYAVYNQNLDRAIQWFSVPLGCAVTVSNLGFHAPPNEPGSNNDGTAGSAGYSNTAWTPTQTTDAMTWNTETLAQNANANAIRWATLYNFSFASNRPPQAANATVGFFKTGAPVTVAIQAPTPDTTCGSLQVTDVVSRKMHGGTAYDIHLPGIESRSGGAGGNHTIVFTFNSNVVSGSASVDGKGVSVLSIPTFNGNTMTVNLTGANDAEIMNITLNNVTDSSARVLATASFQMGVLLGDTSGDGFVNAGDTILTRGLSGQDLNATNFRSDVNVDGLINGADTVLVRLHSGNSITLPH